MSDGIVVIGGNEYYTVAKRLVDFREKHPAYTIKTKLIEAGELVRIKASILDEDGRLLATGTAEEVRGEGKVNSTSAVENCETSAIGRSLAVMGMTGSHIASAEEVERALEQQKEMAGLERLKAHNAAVRDNIESITAMKAHLLNEEYSAAYEAWDELEPDTMKDLWLSTTAGGIFTTQERAQMKSNSWNDARKAHHGIEED